ncbi:MAG: succinate dehydrogenase, cytochrome b556 subunit [Proteobacteria bacterium]|nr:succinate dehydrogenase, cytochrome b556 subunit [Pseudomonadota bacterium]
MIHEQNRPISPHLSIYKPQITTALSILHRISGFALFIGFVVILWWIVYMTYSTNPQQSLLWRAASTDIGMGVIILWSYALFFHLCTGIRHLFLDVGLGFELKTVNWSGWFAVIASLILAIASWCIALSVGGI